jgi:hypothetical protein
LGANIGSENVAVARLVVDDEVADRDVLDGESEWTGTGMFSTVSATRVGAIDFVKPASGSVQIAGRTPIVGEGEVCLNDR